MLRINGYTLIELLIVMAILALLFGFSFAAYTNFNKNRSLENGAREVEVVLRDAQHKAISGEYDQGGTCTKLISWMVNWTADTADYSLVGRCETSGGSMNFSNIPPYKLSSVGTVQFYNSGSITFNSFLQSPIISSPVCIHFSSDVNNFYKVTVTAGGVIDVSRETTCP